MPFPTAAPSYEAVWPESSGPATEVSVGGGLTLYGTGESAVGLPGIMGKRQKVGSSFIDTPSLFQLPTVGGVEDSVDPAMRTEADTVVITTAVGDVSMTEVSLGGQAPPGVIASIGAHVWTTRRDGLPTVPVAGSATLSVTRYMDPLNSLMRWYIEANFNGRNDDSINIAWDGFPGISLPYAPEDVYLRISRKGWEVGWDGEVQQSGADGPLVTEGAPRSVRAGVASAPATSYPNNWTIQGSQIDARWWFSKSPSGMWNTRQRQTASGNAGGWPLRQRHNGGVTGSHPLRQRQTGI